MPRHERPSRRARRASGSNASAQLHQAIERLELRRLLAAQIVGNPTLFPTIQGAVDAAADGATITVEAGNYAETVSIFKKLTIKGAQSGVDGRSNKRGAGESIVSGADTGGGIITTAFKIGANDVVIDGFTVQGITSQSDTQGAGITMLPNIAGTKIINNVIQNNVSGLFVSNNSGTKPAIIQFNYFALNNLPGPASGMAIHTNGSISGGVLTNVIIDSNFFFKNFGGAGTTTLEPAIAFQASPVSQQTNITISNNAFDSNGKAALFYNSDGVLIENNVIQYCRDISSGGLRFEGGDKNITIRNNQLYGSDARGIRIDNKAWQEANFNFTITGNNIWRNGLEPGGQFAGLYVNGGQYSGHLNAENNWWGSATGPSGDGAATGGTGDAVFANGEDVDWSPFATTPFPGQQVPYRGVAWDASSPIPIVDFDHGGEGIGYHDTTTANVPNRLHPLESVDIETSTDVNTTGYNLSYTRAGEWLEYTINVPAAGTYTFEARVANAQSSPGTFHLELDGSTILASTSALSTGSLTIWQNMTKPGITLPAGVHLLRVAFDATGNGGSIGNWNWIRFNPTGVTPPPAAPTNLAASAPTASAVNLTWSDNSNNETGFKIERKVGAGGVWQLLTTTAANATSFQDTTVAAATQYFYRVRSAGTGGAESGNSNEANVTTPAAGVTYLSDLTWVSATNGWGPVEKDMGVGGSGAGDGPAITLNTVVYTKGLGAHAISEIVYNLNGQYATFISDVGVDDRQTTGGSVQFQVLVDNVMLFDSGVMGATSATQTANVSVTGAQQLKLVVLDGGDGTSFDHADWAGARLLASAQPPAAPAAPSNLVATAAGTNQINLTWTDNANNETGFILERSLNGTTGWAQIATPAQNATSYSDAIGLSAGTQYFYRIRATNAGTNSGNSNTANATTQAAPTAPAAPSNLVATAFSSTQINLTWTDNANNETGFILERSPDGVNGWTQVATPAQNATSASDTTVLASTQYFYRIRATNAVGPSGNSNVANATTPAAPTVPAAPSNLAATAVSATQINLTWTDNANNETGFIVERSLNGSTNWTQVGTPAQNATSFSNNTGLSAGTQYFYRVRATNGVGPSANSNVANATTFASSSATFIPTGAVWKYLDNGSNQGTTWRATAFNDSAWASGAAQLGYGDGDEATVVSFGPNASAKFTTTYFRKSFTVADASLVTALNLRLLRDDGAVVYLNGTEVFRSNMPTGTISNTTFASASIEDNTFFTSTVNPALLVSGTNVIAVEIHQSDAGSSDISFNFELTATVQQASVAPAAPSNLVATANGTNRIDLTWTDNANNESGFKIERSLNGVDGWTQIATPAVNATSHSDQTGLSQGTQYFYRIRATNSVSDSGNSNVANATTASPTAPAAPSNLVAAAAGTNQINLTWADNANNETGFIVERSLDGSTGWTQIATPAANATSHNDTLSLSPGTQYFYRVRATNGVGPSGNSNVADATTAVPTAPAAPSNLVATAVAPTQINLTWADNSNNETGFIIERSLDGSTGWTQTATPSVNATSYNDTTGLSAATQYFYRIRATNGVGPSADSNTASATTLTPPSFTDGDIGNVGAAGSSTLVSGTYTVKGAGADIFGKNDAFHFVYQQMTGDGEIIARVVSVQNTNSTAKAGVMMRNTLATNSKHVSLFITPSGTALSIRRNSTNGNSSSTSASGSAAPFWVRIVRSGSTFTTYRSSNGTNWTQVSSSNVSMNSTIFVGLAVCSKVVGTLNTSTFTNVQIVQASPRMASAGSTSGSSLTGSSSKNEASALLDSI